MNQSIEAWRKYHRRNPRDERMAALWVSPLVEHLRHMAGLNSTSAVLDFGCGYFDVGSAIADRVGRADGFDIDDRTVAAARTRAEDCPCSHIYGGSDAIPLKTYDLIVANSVFQYLIDDLEVLRTLRLFRSLLRANGQRQALVGDLIPQSYSAVKDAVRSLWFATTHGALRAMTVHLYKAAFKSDELQLYKIAPKRLAELAAEASFRCERLPLNLTPSRQRYTCLLTAT